MPHPHPTLRDRDPPSMDGSDDTTRERPSFDPGSTIAPRRRTALTGDTLVDGGPSMELPAGRILGGDYVITRRLLRSDVGILYEVEQQSTRRPRTLKVLDRARERGAIARRRFLREARTLARVATPHTVDVIAAGTDEDFLWIALEHLVGETLAARLTSLGASTPMDVAEVWGVLDPLCQALAVAHQEGVVHCDLKPANVFLAGANRNVVKVLDFGVAWVADGSPEENPSGGGTPLWLAPEQADRGEVTPSTDVWSLGLLAFRMLTGRSYWWSARHSVVEARAFAVELLEEPLPPASERAFALGCERALPDNFDGWFARCVARDPRRRFRNADEAALALREVRFESVRSSAAPSPSPSPLPSPRPSTMSAAPPRPSTASSPPAAPRATPPGATPPVTPPLGAPPQAPVAPPAAAPTTARPRREAPTPFGVDNPLSFLNPADEPTKQYLIARRTPSWAPLVGGLAVGVLVALGLVALVTRRLRAPPAVTASAMASVPASPRAPSRAAVPQRTVAPQPRPVAADAAMIAPPPAMPPDATTVVAPPEAPFVWAPHARLSWSGETRGDDGTWRFTMQLQRAANNAVQGRIAWTANTGTTASEGTQVRERVVGAWSNGALELHGTVSSDPEALPVNAWRLRVVADGALRGASIDRATTLTGALAQRRRRHRDDED